ncbi:MAG: hypothetical protein M3247_06655 [Thermoproteota archaeon]|nr:hypothetical protein [Thermoproteota archaeon]
MSAISVSFSGENRFGINQFSLGSDKNLRASLNASNISLYDVASLSNTPSLSAAVLDAVINLSNCQD